MNTTGQSGFFSVGHGKELRNRMFDGWRDEFCWKHWIQKRELPAHAVLKSNQQIKSLTMTRFALVGALCVPSHFGAKQHRLNPNCSKTCDLWWIFSVFQALFVSYKFVLFEKAVCDVCDFFNCSARSRAKSVLACISSCMLHWILKCWPFTEAVFFALVLGFA